MMIMILIDATMDEDTSPEYRRGYEQRNEGRKDRDYIRAINYNISQPMERAATTNK